MENNENNNRIIDVDLRKEMQKSFLDYSMSVIVSRALPDVRDGLKPVHRRILYTMHEKNLGPEKPYRKCADTVGAVLGSYHPHGDASVYDALVKANRLRYRLMPYIYSLAGAAWMEDALLMKPLVFAFPEEEAVYDCKDQYLFGDRLMVCPVTESMYIKDGVLEVHGKPKTRKVYLPAGERWYDVWTETCYDGGQEIEAEAPLDIIPLFVREGSIIPMYKEDRIPESTSALPEDKDVEYRVYKGKDASFCLYTAAGDGYGSERGEYTKLLLKWKEEEGVLLTENS